MNPKTIVLLAGSALALIIGSQSFFIVDQREQAIVLQLGQPIGEPREAGLHLKLPFIQDVRTFDKRVLSIDPRADQVVISSGQTSIKKRVDTNKVAPAKTENPEDIKAAVLEEGPRMDNISGEPIIVDTFARYRITNPLQFMKTLKTVQNANSRLESVLNDSTRAVLGSTTLSELLSAKRTEVMEDIRARVNEKIAQDALGIEIIDVRIVRADLTEELRSSTVKQMNSALHERATERRAEGEEKALEIRSTAEKERTVLLAEAQRDAEIIKGDGDKEAIKIYADAFNVDPEFYSFMRSMEAYKKTMANSETRMILSPESHFFKYFKE
jgi:modulator of FtsH protease HflC